MLLRYVHRDLLATGRPLASTLEPATDRRDVARGDADLIGDLAVRDLSTLGRGGREG